MSLVETLIALVLLTIGLSGLLDLHLNASRAIESARRETQAGYLLEDRLANLQMAGYEALDGWIRSYGRSPGVAEASRFPSFSKSVNPDFEWNALLRREEEGGTKRIAVAATVRWVERQRTKERKATGYVFAP